MVRLPGRMAVSDIGASNGNAVSHKRIALGVQITVDNSPTVHHPDQSRETPSASRDALIRGLTVSGRGYGTSEYRYCRSTVNRLIEYPSAPPTKTSDKKWADSDSLEKPTSAAMPYAAYGTQRWFP